MPPSSAWPMTSRTDPSGVSSQFWEEGSPVWTLKGKDHLIIQTSDLPSERENAWYLYVRNFLEGGQCLRAGQIRDNQQHKGICAPFAWQQENSLCYFITTPWLETQPRTTKNISRKLGDEKTAFFSASSIPHNRHWFKPGCCSARTLPVKHQMPKSLSTFHHHLMKDIAFSYEPHFTLNKKICYFF